MLLYFNSYVYSPVIIFNTTSSLDTLSTSALTSINQAYSCKRVFTRYTGPTMKLRGNSDALQTNLTDFYADVYGNLGTTVNATGISLSTWMSTFGYSNVFIQTLYDQSGKGFHATQTSNVLQPRFMIENKLIDMTSNSYFVFANKTFPSNNVFSTIGTKVGNFVPPLGTNSENGIIAGGTTNSTANAYQVTAFNYSNYFFANWGNTAGTPAGTFSNVSSVLTFKMSNNTPIQTIYPYLRGTSYPLTSFNVSGQGAYLFEYPISAMTSDTTGGGGSGIISSASSTFGGFPAWNVFDKNTTTRWASSRPYNTSTGAPNASSPTTTNIGQGEYIQIIFGTPFILSSYQLTDFYSTPTVANTPVSFIICGTNDTTPSDTGNWTVLDTQTNLVWISNAQETKTFNVTNSLSFSKYRIVITKCGNLGDGYVTINEWKLFANGFDVIGSSVNTGTITDRAMKGYMNYLTVFNSALADSDRVIMETQDLFATPDPYYEYVTLLLHGDGYNGGNVFVDNSILNNNMVITSGTPRTSNIQAVFGQTSIFFPNASWITAPSSPNFTFSNTNFTIEFWFYPTNAGAFSQRPLGNQSGAFFLTGSWSIGTGNPYAIGKIWFITNGGDGVNKVVGPSNQTIVNNQWYHYALVRNGSSFTQYINGVADGTLTYSGNIDVPGTNYPINIGGSGYNASTNETFTGFIDDLRVTKGVARYTSNFTPPQMPFPPYEYPPAPLNFDTTTLTGNPYGNGTYITNASSSNAASTTSNAWYSFDKSNVSAGWSSGLFYTADATGNYVSTRKTTTRVSGVTYLGEWMEITLPHQIVLEGYSLSNRNDALWTQAPASFVIAGTNDYANTWTTNWTLIDTQTSAPWTRSNQTLSFSTSRNSSAYIRYRLIVTKLVNGNNGISATPVEWRLFGFPYSQAAPLDTLSATAKLYLKGAYALEPLFSQSSTKPIVNCTCGSSTQDFYGDTSGTNLTTLPFGGGQRFVDWRSANGGGSVFVNIWYDQSYYVNVTNIQNNATASGSQRPIIETTTTPWSMNYVSTGTFFNLPSGTVPLNSTFSIVTKQSLPASSNATVGGILGGSNNSVRYNGYNGFTHTLGSNVYNYSLQTNTDQYFSNVVLLLHGDGQNGSNIFIDSSLFNSTLSNTGASNTSTLQTRFGYSSISTGTGNIINTSSSLNYALGVSNFTLEFWFYPTAVGSQQRIFGNLNGTGYSGSNKWVLGFNNNTLQFYAINIAGPVLQGTTVISNNQWYHYALVRIGNTFIQYLNGVQDGSTATSSTTIDGGTAQVLTIGGSGNGTSAGETFTGFLDDIRLTNGIARYTSNFTPPSLPFSSVEFPPSGMSSNTINISNQLYGNGIYISNASSNVFFSSNVFDKLTSTSGWNTSTANYGAGGNSWTGGSGTNVTTVIDGTTYTRDWIQIQLPVQISLYSYVLTNRTTIDTGRSPLNWIIAGSEDGNIWTNVHAATATWSGANQTAQFYPLQTSNTYNYYRMVVNTIESGGTGAVSLTEWKLFTSSYEFGSITGPTVSSLVNYISSDPPTSTVGKYYTGGVSTNTWTTYGLINGVAPTNNPITTRTAWNANATVDYLGETATDPANGSYMYWSVISSQAMSDTDRSIVENIDGSLTSPVILNNSFEQPTVNDFSQGAGVVRYWNTSARSGIARDSGTSFLVQNSNVVTGSQCLLLQSTTANGPASANTTITNLIQNTPYTLDFNACFRSQTGLLPTDFYVNVNNSNVLTLNALTLSNLWTSYSTPAFSNISTTALLSFSANAATDATIYIDNVTISPLATPRTYALDGLSTRAQLSMTGAYGLVRLFTNYTGPTLRIRRSSDNAVHDFYADATGNLGTGLNGTGTLMYSWIGSSTSANIVTWYDQSGKGNHMTQTTNGLQPSLFSGNSGVNFANPPNSYLQNSGCFPLGDDLYTCTLKHGTLPSTVGSFFGAGNSTSTCEMLYDNTGLSRYFTRWGTSNDVGSQNGTVSANKVVTYRYIQNGGALASKEFWINGVKSTTQQTSGSSGSARTTPLNNNYIGYGSQTGLYANTQLNFLFITASSVSDSDRVILESVSNVFLNYISSGSLGYYDFSNNLSYPGSGSLVYDLTGNLNTMTLTNAGAFNTSPRSLTFAVNTSAITPQLPYNFSTTGITLEALVFISPSTGTFKFIISTSTRGLVGDAQVALGVYNLNTRVYIWLGDSNFILDNFTVPNNTWTHVVWSCGPSPTYAYQWYINGVQRVGSSDANAAPNGGTTTTLSGGTTSRSIRTTTNNRFVLGKVLAATSDLDSIVGNIAVGRIYNRGLSIGEVLQNYNALKNNGNPYGLP